MSWRFRDVLGQEETVGRLRREAAAGRLAHGYLLEGVPGTGKTSLARAFAASRLCGSPTPDGDACGVCRSCHMLAGNNHPDYLELPREPAELRLGRFVERQSATETVEHQPLLPFLRLKPVEGGMRIAVIPDSERMRTEAANAFLKTLEEPPGHTLIVLTVNARDRLLATIVSRCRKLGVRPLDAAVVAAELERRDIAHGDDARELALAGEGSLGASMELAGGEVLELWRWLRDEGLSSLTPEGARRLAEAWSGFGGGGDNAGKRKGAIRALDLSALVVRSMMRDGLNPRRGARALAALWEAADQIVRNIRPDLALLNGAFGIVAALRS